ncbi:MAG TPA: DUF4255 domain-containing protein [Bacteroidetes bacterium]|nr:DUF4255 domain-containing protein [Bacteroidota bacterium]
MIDEVLDYIRREVRDYLGIGNTEAMLVALHNMKDDNNSPGVYISLVNIEEETALKNASHYIRQNNQVQYKEPPVFLNLYVLFAFEMADYAASLQALSSTIELFQGKRVYSPANENPGNPFPANLEKLVFDFHNLNLEQLNHLWGIQGGAYFPCAMYKVRLVKVQRDEQLAGPEISTITVDTVVN